MIPRTVTLMDFLHNLPALLWLPIIQAQRSASAPCETARRGGGCVGWAIPFDLLRPELDDSCRQISKLPILCGVDQVIPSSQFLMPDDRLSYTKMFPLFASDDSSDARGRRQVWYSTPRRQASMTIKASWVEAT